jgi:hypothetical protein
MPEMKGEGFQPTGEDTPTTPPVETTEPGQPTNPGENPTNPSGNKPDTSNFVPYERFKEVNSELKSLKEQFRGVAPQLETVDRLREAFNPSEYAEPSEFNSPEEYTQYLTEKFDKTWQEREKSLEQKILSSVNARYELESLRQEFPELKEDPQFRNLVVSQLSYQEP